MSIKISHIKIPHIKRACPYGCRNGQVEAMGEANCPTCAGSGRDKRSNCWSQPCPNRNCHNGKVATLYNKKCPHCR